MTNRSDSRYPVTYWPQLQFLHRWGPVTGVPFLTFTLTMTFISNPVLPEVVSRGTSDHGLYGALPLSYRSSRSGRDSNPRLPALQAKYPSSTPPAMFLSACTRLNVRRGISDGSFGASVL